MPDDAIPIDRDQAKAALEEIVRRSPPDWTVMPIGGLGMMGLLDDPSQRTRDVDLVPFVALGKDFRLPDHDALVSFAKSLSDRVDTRNDQTSVAVLLALEGGRVKVELIRGRNPRSGGYLVTRRALEACAKISVRKGRILLIPPEALAFLKAWAATDQDKLVRKGKDPNGYHRSRAAAFRGDVQRIARSFLDRGKKPPVLRIRPLLAQCAEDRQERVRQVLLAAGWHI